LSKTKFPIKKEKLNKTSF